MSRKKKKEEKREQMAIKDFFDRILPGVLKFYSDHYICGDSYRCVWAIKEYPPSTEEQAILRQLADRTHVTLSWKVKSAFFDVELHDGQLWGVADCQLLESLEGDELGRLTTYLTGQASDGWGEGFEQREIPVGKGLLYVHLWDGQNWEMTTTGPEQREKGEMRFGQSL